MLELNAWMEYLVVYEEMLTIHISTFLFSFSDFLRKRIIIFLAIKPTRDKWTVDIVELTHTHGHKKTNKKENNKSNTNHIQFGRYFLSNSLSCQFLKISIPET